MAIIATQPSGARNANAPAPATARTMARTINAPQNHNMCECFMIETSEDRFAHEWLKSRGTETILAQRLAARIGTQHRFHSGATTYLRGITRPASRTCTTSEERLRPSPAGSTGQEPYP